MTPLQFPLVGEENRPIRDAAGRLVSVQENAALFVAAANLCAEIAACEDGYDLGEFTWQRARKIVGRE